MDIVEAMKRLHAQLIQVYLQYGDLSHPEVVKASQQLDQALNEFQRQTSATTRS
jgi:hypothetical protein